MILTIATAAALPLALGSVRHRTLAATRAGTAETAVATMLSLRPARTGRSTLDDRLEREIENDLPNVRAVRVRYLLTRVVGPVGTDFLALQTLAERDPRLAGLRLDPPIRTGLGSRDVVVSDALGELLFGEGWTDAWRAGEFLGPPLLLEPGEPPDAAEFRVVARRHGSGRALYADFTAIRSLCERPEPTEPKSERADSGGCDWWDEVVVHVPRIGEVEAVARRLRERFPGLTVHHDELATTRLRHLDTWLLALFWVILASSATVSGLVFQERLRADTERAPRGSEERPATAIACRAALRIATAAAIGCVLTCFAFVVARGLVAAGPDRTPPWGIERETVLHALALDPLAVAQALGPLGICLAYVTWRHARLPEPGRKDRPR